MSLKLDTVTERTKFADIAPFLEYIVPSTREALKVAATGVYGDPWAITIGEFFAHVGGDFSRIGVDITRPDKMLALQYFWVEAFKDMCEQLTKTLEALQPPQTPDAKNAAQACKKLSFREGVLLFCRDYFGLHSFAEVDALYIGDLLLAKKDKYNQAVFERAIAAIHDQKLKANKRK